MAKFDPAPGRYTHDWAPSHAGRLVDRAFGWLMPRGLAAPKVLMSEPGLLKEAPSVTPMKKHSVRNSVLRAIAERLHAVALRTLQARHGIGRDARGRTKRNYTIEWLIEDAMTRVHDHPGRVEEAESSEALASDIARETLREANLDRDGVSFVVAASMELWNSDGEGTTVEAVCRSAIEQRLIKAVEEEIGVMAASAAENTTAAMPQ